MLDNDETRAAIQLVREYLRSEVGIEVLVLDESFVPAALRDVVPLAAQFGVGDDGARGHALSLMPAVFLEELQKLMAERREALQEWLSDESPWEDEKDAFCALLQGVDVTRPRRSTAPATAEELNALKEAIARFSKGGVVK